jgi:protocatechuate 4,5-dioxygenase beta chain
MESLTGNMARITSINQRHHVERSDSRGAEVMNRVATRGAPLGEVRELHRNHHVRISNSPSGAMLLENRPRVARAT